jgi:putative redox protein
VDVISVEVELEGNLSPEQRAQLLDVAHRCPVHKTLTSETLVHIHDRH